MPFTNNSIEIVILTGGRFEYFKESLESVLNQTVKNFKITIINNIAVDDGTEQYVKSLQEKNNNIYYFKQPNRVEADENLETAKKFVSKDYVIFFHDDDIMHPQYIEYVLKLLNKYDNVDLICSLLHSFKNKEELRIVNFEKIKYRIFNTKLKFIRHVYSSYCTDGTSLVFPNIVYRTKNIDKLVIRRDLYGRASDKPSVINFIQDGKVIQIIEKDCLYYRQHAGQDTNSGAKDPTLKQIAEYNIYFKNLLDDSFVSKLIFNMYSVKWVKSLYRWAKLDTDMIFFVFIKSLYKMHAINLSALFWGHIPMKLIMKPFNYIERNYLSKKL